MVKKRVHNKDNIGSDREDAAVNLQLFAPGSGENCPTNRLRLEEQKQDATL